MRRLIPAVLAGAAIACFAAVALGEYPLTGVIPWLACVIVPALVGTAMTGIAGGHRRSLWIATGPLSAASLAWGVAISVSWGIDPVPAVAWVEVALGLAWPVAWGLFPDRRTPPVDGEPGGPAEHATGERSERAVGSERPATG